MAEFDLDSVLDRLIQLPTDKQRVLFEKSQQFAAQQGMARWQPNPGSQSDAYFSEADETGYGGEAGPGKLLAIDTPLPTPFGWTTMGEVRAGDYLIDRDGLPCRVTFKSNIQAERTYRLVFSDGSEIVAGERHQWITSDYVERGRAWRCTDETRAARRATRALRGTGKRPDLVARNKFTAKPAKLSAESIRTTQQIAETLRVRGARFNHSIPVCKAFELPEAELLIDPYTLGAWLGDGTSSSGSITGIDEEIFANIGNGYRVSVRADPISRGIIGLQAHLRALGLLGNKHIPAAYLRASFAQRLSLLQGLMDTDGTCDYRDGSCSFTSTREALATGIYELLSTLGIKATLSEGLAKLHGRIIGPKFNVRFMSAIPAFRLGRKLIRQKRGGFRGPHALRYIVDAIEVPQVPMQCVQVDSPSSTYLCGRAMIPTHNTSLIIGLSITAHQRSLVLRRTSVEARGLVDEYEKVLGGRPTLDRNETFRVDGRRIQIGGCDHEERKQKYKGLPRDLIAFDELPDFTESQYTFIIQWARSTDPKQRCRVVATFNPPTRATGLWVINRFAPWLDPHHPNPADSGEIRWFTTVDGRDTEVDGPGPHDVGEAEPVKALSRTFIRGYLSENTALAATGYDATRAAAPKIYRDAYRSGDFEAALADVPNQVCPTAWVRAAVQRWSPRPPDGIPMCSIGVDASGGGEDPMVLAIRHDGWYAPMIEIPGKNIPEDRPGHYAAGVVMGYRRDDALIVVDMGGGYGGPLYEKLHDNHVAAEAFKGSEKSTRRTREGKKGFANRRSEIYWKFREALDPEQPGGSPIFLPDDRLLIADLTAPVFLEDSHVIELEPKERVRERLGRSPDRGDATVMAWAAGMRYVQGGMALERAQKFNYAGGRRPQVLMGRGKYNAPRR